MALFKDSSREFDLTKEEDVSMKQQLEVNGILINFLKNCISL